MQGSILICFLNQQFGSSMLMSIDQLSCCALYEGIRKGTEKTFNNFEKFSEPIFNAPVF